VLECKRRQVVISFEETRKRRGKQRVCHVRVVASAFAI
jgi:hypothetical protein